VPWTIRTLAAGPSPLVNGAISFHLLHSRRNDGRVKRKSRAEALLSLSSRADPQHALIDRPPNRSEQRQRFPRLRGFPPKTQTAFDEDDFEFSSRGHISAEPLLGRMPSPCFIGGTIHAVSGVVIILCTPCPKKSIHQTEACTGSRAGGSTGRDCRQVRSARAPGAGLEFCGAMRFD
jgi:hypothetical protein